MSHSINLNSTHSFSAVRSTLTGLAAALLLTMMATNVSAQSAGSWVDIGNGFAGAGGSASGPISIVKGRSSSKNGMQFGHGFALGAGPNGLAISNSVGAGAGPGGVAHNMNLNIGADGTHFSQGGVVSQGGNRRVISGGQTGTRNGQVYGGSQSSGFGQNTKAWSQSHTRQWGQPSYQPAVQPSYQSAVQPSFQSNRSHRSGGSSQRWFGNRR